MDLDLALQIAGTLFTVGLAYGLLKADIIALKNQRSICDKKFESIEKRHDSSTEGIRAEVKSISNTLNQLVGKIDLFFQLYNKDNQHEQKL